LPSPIPNITVITPNGSTTTTPAPGPVISNVSFIFNPSGQVTLTITGTGFGADSQLLVGNVPVPVTSATATTLTATLPSLPSPIPSITVITPNGSFTTTPAPGPVISNISFTTNPSGQVTLTITGTGFGANSQLLVGNVPVPVTSATATTLTATLPSLPSPIPNITVIAPNGQQVVFVPSSPPTTTTPASAPVIYAVSPNASGPGDLIEIFGTNFQPGSQVLIGGVPATPSGIQTPTVLTVIVPPLRVGLTDVTVVTPDGHQVTLPGAFFALSAP
jgi:hypothetical protein